MLPNDKREDCAADHGAGSSEQRCVAGRHKRRQPAFTAPVTTRLPVPKPAGCLETTPAQNLQRALDAAPPGGALCLGIGLYSGPVVINKSLTIWGPRSAVIQSTGRGSTLTVAGNNVQLLGFTIRGSGNRFDLNDSALKVRADHVLIQDLRMEGALFGLTAERASHVIFRGNDVAGDLSRPVVRWASEETPFAFGRRRTRCSIRTELPAAATSSSGIHRAIASQAT